VHVVHHEIQIIVKVEIMFALEIMYVILELFWT